MSLIDKKNPSVNSSIKWARIFLPFFLYARETQRLFVFFHSHVLLIFAWDNLIFLLLPHSTTVAASLSHLQLRSVRPLSLSPSSPSSSLYLRFSTKTLSSLAHTGMGQCLYSSPFQGTMQPKTVSTAQHHRCLLEVQPKPMLVTTTMHLALFGMSVIYFLNGFFTRWIKIKERSRTKTKRKRTRLRYLPTIFPSVIITNILIDNYQEIFPKIITDD